jgi:hypothetical protein
MAGSSRLTIELTREQRLALLAATGMLVGALEIDPDALAEGEEAPAHLPRPEESRWGSLPAGERK